MQTVGPLPCSRTTDSRIDMGAATRHDCDKITPPDSKVGVCVAVPAAPLPSRPEARSAAAAEPATGPYYDLPDHPPYKVYIGNVPYELQQADVADFFRDLQVSCPRQAANLRSNFELVYGQ